MYSKENKFIEFKSVTCILMIQRTEWLPTINNDRLCFVIVVAIFPDLQKAKLRKWQISSGVC